jgi:hypothetical protein
VTALVARSASAAVPAGTRLVSVRIDATRDEGSYNDGYIDNVSLVLGGGAPVFHKTVVVRVVSGKVRVRRPGSRAFVELSGSEGIPLGSTVDTLSGVVELTSVPKAGGTPQSARFYEGVFKVTQVGSVTNLALTERWPRVAAAGPARRRPRSASATCGATARAPSAPTARTARPRCAARSGSCRTAAPER